MNPALKYSLEHLDMITNGNYAEGLISVQDFMDNDLPPDEIIALENAKRYKADYVYFRKFKNRPSIPQVYLYDFTDKLGVEDEELTKLHHQLYSSVQVPMFFVFTKQDVKIFNCFEPPQVGEKIHYKPLTTIKLAADLSKVLKKRDRETFDAFSGKLIDNGTFWENSKYGKKFSFSKSAYEKLLTELKNALKYIVNKEILPADMARRIMVTAILIKYLEDREDERGNKVFPPDFFKQFAANATKFSEIFGTTGAYLKLLDYLAKHFNGGIFELETAERTFLKNKDLTRFGHFLEGNLDGNQLVLWSLYSFNDLPVELISNIYEEVIQKQRGVVYTPPYLVDFLLDEAMPLTQDDTDFKVLDPACGSGVFLVGAYRRLVYRWRKKHNWQQPRLSTLKKLLRENIFGVELSKQAAELTVFSLSLALCDELTPLQIWQDLRFDDLHEENILRGTDFFTILEKEEFQNKFDLIIGNPPFIPRLTESAQEVEAVASKKRKLSIKENNKTREVNVQLPYNQIALLFLEQSVKLCKENGLVCLIQPSTPLLYNKGSFLFRTSLFRKYDIPQIIDFTHLNRVLFTVGKSKKERTGDVPVSAVFIKKCPPSRDFTLHILPKRIKASKEKIYFQLDNYDFHKIPREECLSNPSVWKSNLFGGTRANSLIQYLESFDKLKSFLDSKKLNSAWDYGEGFMKGKEGNKKADFLTGQKALLAPNFSADKIVLTNNLEQEWFVRPRRKTLYKAPLLLIKEQVEAKNNLIPVYKSDEYLVFDSRIVGISSNNNDVQDLEKLFSYFKKHNRLFAFYIALTSSQFSISRSSVSRSDDIYNLPYPKNEGIELTKQEQIIIDDVLDKLLDFKRKGEKSTIATQDASKKDLKLFSDTFSEILATTFKSIKPHDYFETESYICLPFYFGKKPNIDFSDSEQAEKNIAELVHKKAGVSLRLTRIIRIYEGNVIYLIKPKKLRYWLQSIALRDADETFADLRKQGY